MIVYNIIADGWTAGEFCLGECVKTRAEAERHAEVFRNRYEGKPYPNGKGWYSCRNFRVVAIELKED